MVKFVCKSLKDTQNAAKYFSQFAKAGQCFALFGDLGYGKTTFTRYFVRLLNKSNEDVQSPSFTLVQIYDSAIAEIWHVDCYRWKSPDAFYELGLEDALLNCITIIEWPEIILHLLPPDTIKIKFSLVGKIRELDYEFHSWK
jgi:tRNA threonylcarbamoyladenosine biosynthesis protein TsaE